MNKNIFNIFASLKLFVMRLAIKTGGGGNILAD